MNDFLKQLNRVFQSKINECEENFKWYSDPENSGIYSDEECRRELFKARIYNHVLKIIHEEYSEYERGIKTSEQMTKMHEILDKMIDVVKDKS